MSNKQNCGPQAPGPLTRSVFACWGGGVLACARREKEDTLACGFEHIWATLPTEAKTQKPRAKSQKPKAKSQYASHDLFLPQPRNLLFRISNLAQHLVRMLAQRCRSPANAARRGRQAHRRVRQRHRLRRSRMLDILQQLPRLHLRIIQHLL